MNGDIPPSKSGLKRKYLTSGISPHLLETLHIFETFKPTTPKGIKTTTEFFDVNREPLEWRNEDDDQGCNVTEKCCNDTATDHHPVVDHTVSTNAEYTPFLALVHLVDDSLEQVSELTLEKLRLISVDVDQSEEKLIIFDTGKGMDETSIRQWGTPRSELAPPSNGAAKPLFLYQESGYGVITAAFRLGRSVTLSCRTAASNRVTVLHLGRSTWEEGVRANGIWKTQGEARNATEEEVNNSPHGSFRKVEICGVKKEVLQLDVSELQRRLKDFFFPHIEALGYQSSCGLHTKAITMMVMGLDLANLEESHMAIIKSLSSSRKPLVIHLQLTDSAGVSGARATITCHYYPVIKGVELMECLRQRLKEDFGVTGPFEDDGHDFSNYVTVRWRGRLLLREKWKSLPFMESNDLGLAPQHCCKRVLVFIDTDDGFILTPSKTSLAPDNHFTKALISLGLQQKNDSLVDSSRTRAHVTIEGEGWPLTSQSLCEEFRKWVQNSSKTYDVEADVENGVQLHSEHTPQTCVTKLHNKLELGITMPVFQVTWKMWIQGVELSTRGSDKGPVRLKLVKQSSAQQPLFFTLECFVCAGPTYVICRPIHVPEVQGSTLVEGPDSSTFYLRDSKAFPLEEPFWEKFIEVDENTWTTYEDKLYGDNPASVELLNTLEMQKFGLHGVIPSNSSVEAGYTLPKEILAVVRPRSCSKTSPGPKCGTSKSRTFCRANQSTIISEPMEVNLEVRFMDYVSEENSLSEYQISSSKTVYHCTTKACTRKGVRGLYSFVTHGTALRNLFATTGTYLLAFSLAWRYCLSVNEEQPIWFIAGQTRFSTSGHAKMSSTLIEPIENVFYSNLYTTSKHAPRAYKPKIWDFLKLHGMQVSERHWNVAPVVARINVSAAEGERWQICFHLGACSNYPDHWKFKGISTRLGEVMTNSLYLTKIDDYNNQVAFSEVPEEVHLDIANPNGESLQISASLLKQGMNLIADNTVLELKGVEIGGGSLAQIAPSYNAILGIFFHSFPVASYQLTVYPGEATSVALTECDRLDNCLRPGQVIEKFVLQVFDDHKNVVEQGRALHIVVEGLQVLDKQEPNRQVDEHGCLRLGGLLKVTAGYNSKGTIAISSDTGKSLLTLNFHTVYRSLRVLKDPGEACVGSQLEDLEVQVIDENGTVDNLMEGFPHSLTIDWNFEASLPLHHGACRLPAITLPAVPGTWHGRVAHAFYPELFFVIEVEVVISLSTSDLNLVPVPLDLSPVQVSTPPQVLQQVWNVKKEVGETSALRDEYGRQLKDFIDRNTKLQRKLREQGRKVKTAEEELGILKRTRKEVDDMEALWKEELKVFEAVSSTAAEVQTADANQNGNTASQVIEVIKKQGDPPGSHAASVLLEAVMDNGEVFSPGRAGGDILGVVGLLASVDDDLLNRALVDYLGIEKMLMIVCRSEEGMKYLHTIDPNGGEDEDFDTLHSFARSRNRCIKGRFRVLVLDEASFYKQQEGLPSVAEEHPQKLLIMPDPGPAGGPCPEGFQGYAVNLLRFNPQQLQCYATPAKHTLRESLFFQLFAYLQVYDTKDHMLAAQEFFSTGAVSLDGGLIQTKGTLEHILGEDCAVKFPVLNEKSTTVEQPLAMASTNLHQEKQYLMNTVHFELAQKIQALHEETGYIRLSLHIKKMETKLIRARSKISALAKEVKREEDRKAEILRRVADLQDDT